MLRQSIVSLSLLFCAGGAAQDLPAAPATIPIEHFTRSDEFGGMKIAPDGKFLALQTGNRAIAFIDLEHKKIGGNGITVQENSEVYDYRWLSPTRLLIMLGERDDELSPPVATRWAIAVDRDGGAEQGLHCCTPYSQWGMPFRLPVAGPELLGSDERHIVIAEHPGRDMGAARRANPFKKPTIFRTDVYSGNRVQLGVAPLFGARVLLDRDNKVRVALGLDQDGRLAVSWRRQPESKWDTLFLENVRDESMVPRRFSSDNRSVFLTGVGEGASFAGLYRLDLQTLQLERVHAFADADVTDVITDFADREIVGVRGYGERPIEGWLRQDDPAAQTYQALHRAFPGQRVTLTSATSDGRTAIVLVDSDVNPGDYYMFDTVEKHATFLRAARKWIDPKQMRPKEPIALKARDGLLLHGYVTRPAGDGAHPMVVLTHDGPFGVRHAWEFDWEVQLLASRGYAVLQVNHRGSPGYGLEFERAGRGEWGAKVQDDIADATRWAAEQHIAVADRICIYGKFYGGYAALAGAVREPALYRCAIGYAGVYDVEADLDADSADGGKAVALAFGSEDAKQLRALSPAFNAEKIRAKILLIYGDWPSYRSNKRAQPMKLALEKNGKLFESLTVSRHDSKLYDPNTRREVYERILAFLDANLSAPAGTP